MERRLTVVVAADMVGYSRLMEQDADDVLRRHRKYRLTLIDVEIARFRGQIVKTTGDGLLVEFLSALEAVQCIVAIQQEMAHREHSSDPMRRIQYRMGISLGDVLSDGEDIFGDCVNIAARLEGVSEPGGICIADNVRQAINHPVINGFRDLGRQRVKNISRPIRVWQWTLDAPEEPARPALASGQRVRFCSSEDGTQIAWAQVGSGPPLVRAPHWLSHLEYEWTNPLFGPLITGLAERTTYLRFDQRGSGLSERDVADLSLDAMVQDVEAVVDAAGIQRFALLCSSQGAACGVRYAAKHPDRVSCLVFLGGYLRGQLRRGDAEQAQLFETGRRLMKEGWGSANPIFRQFFTSGFIPDATAEAQAQFDELQRLSTDPQNAVRLFEMNAGFDVEEEARRLNVPALVFHARDDRRVPIEEGRRIARAIPMAEFVELPGSGHTVLQGTPAFDQFVEQSADFVSHHA